jgi:hypothetical protein
MGCSPPSGQVTSRLEVQQSSAAVSSYDFLNGIVGVPGAAVAFTIVNDGSATVNLGGLGAIRITGSNAAEFAASALASTELSPGQSTTFKLTFIPAAPATTQARTATVTVQPVSGGVSTSFSVKGTGIAFGVEQSGAVVSNYDFGTCPTGAGNTVTFTIHNQGSTQIDLASVGLAGSTDFLASMPSPSPVAPGGTASFTITFTPAGYEVQQTCDATVCSVDGLTSYTFKLKGLGTSGVFDLKDSLGITVTNGTLIDFGTVPSGYSAPARTYYIHNLSTGSDNLIFATQLSDLAAFSVNVNVTPVLPGQSQSFEVVAGKKSGVAPGTYNATLTITTSDVGHPIFTLLLAMVSK